MAGLGQERVRLRTAFLATGFAAVGSFGYQIRRQGREHFGIEPVPAAVVSGGDFGDRLAVVVEGIASPGEANPRQGHVAGERRLGHEATNEVVSDEMHLEFLLGHRRRAATEQIHIQDRLEVIPKEFNVPASAIQRGQEFDGPPLGIGEGRGQSNRTAAAAGGP